MDNTSLINSLTAAVTDCAITLANPMSKRGELIAANDKVLGLVSTCNLSLDRFTPEERKQFDTLYEKATHICQRTRRLAAIVKA